MSQQRLLKRLIENAMGFLSHSIEEFDEHPKYSVIHFHAAVELFLKARLMAEHWSLVVSKRKDPDWNKFMEGDFQSVTLDEAVGKLDKVVRSGLTKQEVETFRRLTKHRNKMVHFFHEAVTAEENQELRRTIAKEQLTAWYLLHNLLTDRWADIFSSWSTEIENIDKRLRKLNEYLQVVFSQLKPKIQKREANGAIFRDCPSCGFKSQEHVGELGKLYEALCLVCGFTDTCIAIECHCSTEVLFINEGFSKCKSCGDIYEPEHLANGLIANGGALIPALDGDDHGPLGNCSDCDGYHTVVQLDDGDKEYFCASCFSIFYTLQSCDWCVEPNTGDMEHSSWSGCNFCDGKAGWYSDRDD